MAWVLGCGVSEEGREVQEGGGGETGGDNDRAREERKKTYPL